MGEKIAFLEIVPRIKTKTYSPGSAAEEECLLATQSEFSMNTALDGIWR